METTGNNKIVILTALSVEYSAVAGQLTNLQREDHPTSGMICEHGELPGTPWQVYIAEAGEGNQSAAALTEHVIGWLKPRAVFFTGIAGGLKRDINLGDVVVATQVWAYQGGKQEADGFKNRPRTWETTFALQQAARYVARGPWTDRLASQSDPRPMIYLKPILAGEIVLDASDSALNAYLDTHYNGAAAIEMEGAGFASAAHLAGHTPFLVIRGISDKADGTKQSTDTTGGQDTAARNAAAATMAIIAALPTPTSAPSSTESTQPDRSPSAPPAAAAEPRWHTLAAPATVRWRTDLLPSWGNDPVALEVHLIPLDGNRLEVRRLQQIGEDIITVGRTRGVFSATEQIESSTTAEQTHAVARGQRWGNTGLAVLRSGQCSAWEPLPKPGLVAVLDPEHVQERITHLLDLVQQFGVPATPTYAIAVGIDPAQMITKASLSQVDPHRTTLSMKSDPVRIQPDDAVDSNTLVSAPHALAEELAARLIHAYDDRRR